MVVKSIVYYGVKDTIYCYEPSQDKWTEPLPLPPFQCCGLGQIDGKLVLVGGRNKNNEALNEVYTYKESIRTLKSAEIETDNSSHANS